MDRLRPFLLEDFFEQYEHRSDIINLASSDALPWSLKELENIGVPMDLNVGLESFCYPDVKQRIHPGLEAVCDVPLGWSILPTTGAAEAIAITMHELSASGKCESIAIPSPSYGAFAGLARLLRLEIYTYSYLRDSAWAVDTSELLRLAATCDAIVVVNPHNPTGQLIENNTLQEVADKLTDRGKSLIVDEVFRIAGEESHARRLAQKGRNVLILGSLSKTYGLPGLRLGWIIAPRDQFRRMRTIQYYLTLSPSTMTATLAASILGRLKDFSRGTLIQQNRKVIRQWATDHRGLVSISEPNGGTTVVVEFASAATEVELFNAFMKQSVLLVPGSKFDMPPEPAWFRLGYATQEDHLYDGLQRLITAIEGLSD